MALPRLSDALRAVNDLAVADLAPVWALPVAELAGALLDVVPAAVERWGEAADSVAADWYDELRDLDDVAGRFSAIVEPGDLGAQALAGWAAEPLGRPVPDVATARLRAEGGMQQRLANAASLTVTRSAVADPAARGYMRRTDPGACRFCRMVASRGAVYTRETARFSCHPGCYCEALPAWGGRALPVAPYRKSDRPNNAEELARVKQWINDNHGLLDDVAAGERARVDQRRDQDTAAWLDAEDDYQHALAYWRRVDAEDLHSVPAAQAAEPPAPPAAESPLEKALREFEEAVESGDDDRIDAAAAALEQAEDDAQKAADKAARDAERKAAKANADADRIVELIEEGWEPAEAEAEVTGRTVESIRRRDFIAQARADGHVGAGFDELLVSVFEERIAEMALAAENATNGFMLKRQYQLTINPKQLWLVNDVTARKWMSDEMAAWFDANGRLTRPILREMILRGDYSGRFNQQGQDYLQ